MNRAHRNVLGAMLLLCGCVNPWNTRMPEVAPRSTQYEQSQAKVQDPFPDADIGPDVGFRPLDYRQQRSEPLRSKERVNAAILRQQLGVPGGGTAPGINGSMYPDAVRE
jgi:hypothetical protein